MSLSEEKHTAGKKAERMRAKSRPLGGRRAPASLRSGRKGNVRESRAGEFRAETVLILQKPLR